MRFLLTIALIAFLTASDHASGEMPATPILIDVSDSEPAVIQLAGQQMSVDQVKEWLREVSDKFGGEDPVIVRLESNQNILLAAKLAQISTTTHQNVFIGLNDPDSKDFSLYLVPVSSKEADFKISPMGRTKMERTIPTHFPQFEEPISPGAEQMRRLEKLNQGEIP